MSSHSRIALALLCTLGTLAAAPAQAKVRARPARKDTPPPPPKVPEVIADDLAGARALRQDRRNLYLLTDDAVVRLAKAGGAITSLSPAKAPLDLSVQRDRLYWSEPEEGKIRSVTVDGQAPTVLAEGRNHPRWLTSDPSALYWVEEGTQPVLFTMRRGGSAATELVNLFASFLDLQSAGAYLYWSDFDGAVFQVSKFGGAPDTVERDKLAPGGHLALDDRYLFWTHPVSQVVKRKPRGGGRTVVLADQQPGPGALALVGNDVYFASNDAKQGKYRLLRVSKRGGKPIVAAELERPIVDLAADEQSVYLIEEAAAAEGGKPGPARRLLRISR